MFRKLGSRVLDLGFRFQILGSSGLRFWVYVLVFMSQFSGSSELGFWV